MDSIPSPQTILTMHDKLTMAMLPASVKNIQDYDSRDFLFWILLILIPLFFAVTFLCTYTWGSPTT